MAWHPLITLVVTLRLTLGLFTQPQPPMLTVSLRDLAGSGVAGATVLVRDASGEREYARALTDGEGIATIEAVPSPDVRVAVVGALANGTPLILRGDDALGIRYTLTSDLASMFLRVDSDGSVIPDPERSVALEHDGNASDLPPEAAVAPTAVAAVPTAAPTTDLPSDSVTERAAAGTETVPVWQLVLVVAAVVLLGGGATALILMRERL